MSREGAWPTSLEARPASRQCPQGSHALGPRVEAAHGLGQGKRALKKDWADSKRFR